MGNKFLFIGGKQIPVTDEQLESMRDTYAKRQSEPKIEKKYMPGQVVVYRVGEKEYVGKVHNFSKDGGYLLAKAISAKSVGGQPHYQFANGEYHKVAESDITKKLA